MSVACVALSPLLEESLNFSGITGRCGQPSSDSILIYLSIAGSVIPMPVMESDSIASVKLRIQTFKGFSVKKQKLVYKGRELARNDSRVQDYGLADGNVLHLVLRFSDLLAITVKTVCGKEFGFCVERGRCVGYVKQKISKKEDVLVDLNDQELVLNDVELDDQTLVTDLCKDSETVINLIVRKSAKVRVKPVEKDFEVSIEAREHSKEQPVVYQIVEAKPDFLLEPLVVDLNIALPLTTQELISTTLEGLDRGYEPIRSSEGSGGAYFMQDSSGQRYVSVFKPTDEEPMALNNPRGLPLSPDGEGLKKGTRVGEGALREVAAYVLDHPLTGPRLGTFSYDEEGYAGVPPTVMVKCLHKGFNHPEGYYDASDSKYVKIGSLQMFADSVGSCEDMGYSGFPVDQVHKISVLDIRLANADRHAGNILVCKNGDDEDKVVLVPIDHGYCLPEKFEDCTFEWLYWPQSRVPYSSQTIDYIKSLDPEADIELLRSHGWELGADTVRVFRISTMLLKKGAARQLTPFAIGSIMCRETLNKESVLEKIIQEAHNSLSSGSSEDVFLEKVASIIDHYLDELSF